jgi:hypothetical protein
LEVEAQIFVEDLGVNKLTADISALYNLDDRELYNEGMLLVVKGEPEAHLPADFECMRAGKAESDAVSGDVQYGYKTTAACGRLQFVGAGELSFFAVVPAKIQMKTPGVIASASSVQGVSFSLELFHIEILNNPALGAFDYGDAMRIDKRFLKVHFFIV